jgi:hypothetical protein
MKKSFISAIVLIFIISALGSSCSPAPVKAAGATLFLSPGSGTFPAGKSFSVKVMVSSGDVAAGVNAAEGSIKYDPAMLTVSNLNNAGSIFKLWTTDPTFSNSAGTITYGGGSPSAYKGTAGEIFSITFVASKAGNTTVSFNSGIVLAADGKGTNVFGGFGNAQFVIQEKTAEVKTPVAKPTETKQEVKGILPPLPDVTSKTHPDDNIWYVDNSPEFLWKVLSDLTGVSYDVTSDPASDPGAENDGIVENAKMEKQADGQWYFHIKYQNRFGWGQIAHRKFKIDATPPEAFMITEDNEGDSTNPTPKLRFTTKDVTSGIKQYEVITGVSKEVVDVSQMEAGYYLMKVLAPGEYITSINVIDNAGNSASSSVKYVIDALKSPIITDMPKVINKKTEIIIRGTSFYPHVTIKLFVDNGKDILDYTTQTDDNGNWSYFHTKGLEKGSYEVYARVIDERGAQSLDSSRNILTVISPSIIESYGLLIIIILILIIAVLILYILYQDKTFTEEKRRIKHETQEVKAKLSKIFAALREEVDELIELSDKRPGLSESERRVKEKLQESLDISEEFISKEVEDVEKEIKLRASKEKK